MFTYVIDFDDKDLAIIGLVVLGVVSLILLGLNGVQIVHDVVIALGSLAVGRKLMSKNRNA